MKTIQHMCLSIDGYLRKLESTRNKNKDSCFDDDKGNPITIKEAIFYLKNERNKGRLVLPMSKDCVGFNYQTGCPGHEQKDGET